jgi:predicted ester cyclase
VLPPSGKPVAFDEIVILQLRDGKVVHQSGIADNLTALRQLGILPTPPS